MPSVLVVAGGLAAAAVAVADVALGWDQEQETCDNYHLRVQEAFYQSQARAVYTVENDGGNIAMNTFDKDTGFPVTEETRVVGLSYTYNISAYFINPEHGFFLKHLGEGEHGAKTCWGTLEVDSFDKDSHPLMHLLVDS